MLNYVGPREANVLSLFASLKIKYHRLKGNLKAQLNEA